MTNDEFRMTNQCRSLNVEMKRGHRAVRSSGLRLPSSFIILISSFSLLGGCGKKQIAVKATVAAPVVVQPTLLTEAARLGLASRVPGDVEFCVSSVQLRQHAELLKATRWWSQMMALVEDKTPATNATASAPPIDEMFLTLGKDSAKSLTTLRQLNDLYNETAYRGMMSGGVLAGLGKSFDAKKLLETALRDARVLEAVILLLERFEMPPVMIGAASPEPQAVLKWASDQLHLSAWLGDTPQSRIVTTQGEQLTVNEIAMSEVLTVERRREWLEALKLALPEITPEMQGRIAHGLDVLARKQWVLALGLGEKRAYLAVAKSKEQIRLANTVEDSLLARPELRFADAHAAEKNLGLIACWDGVFLNALQAEEPFQPIVRGLLAGLQSEKMFAGMARMLEPLVVDLAAAERAFYPRDHSNGAAVLRWDGGLQADFAGGLGAASVAALAQPSQFTALLDEPTVVFGMSGHGSSAGAGRAYFEAWMKLAHATAAELVKAGVGGAPMAAMFKQVDQAVLPGILGVYDGTKTIWQKALGSDGAFILDVGGKMPPLPGLPAGGEAVPLPRLLNVQEVKTRALIGVSWQNMEAGLRQVIQGIPAPEPITLPPAQALRSGDLTSYFYELPLGSGDLMPCASLSEKLFMLGTSRTQQQRVAEALGRPSATAGTPGTQVKLSVPKLREFLKAFVAARAQNGGAEDLKAALKWLAPFETLEARVWSEGGGARGRLSWQMHDVLSYD